MLAVYAPDNNTVVVRNILSGEEILKHHISDAVINNNEFVNTKIKGIGETEITESLPQNGAIVEGKTDIV